MPYHRFYNKTIEYSTLGAKAFTNGVGALGSRNATRTSHIIIYSTSDSSIYDPLSGSH
jgi:hypothetical protein